MGLHEFPNAGKIADRSRQPRKLGDHDEIDVTFAYSAEQPLQLRSLGVLAGSGFIDKEPTDVAEISLGIFQFNELTKPLLLAFDRPFWIFSLLFGGNADVKCNLMTGLIRVEFLRVLLHAIGFPSGATGTCQESLNYRLIQAEIDPG